MPHLKNVIRRPGSNMLSVRVTVPKELRASVGKREYWKSLGTSDAKAAEIPALNALAEIKAELDAHRRRREPTSADIDKAVRDFARRELQIDLKTRREYLTQADYDLEQKRIYENVADEKCRQQALCDLDHSYAQPDRDRKRRGSFEAELRKHIARNETALINWAADEIVVQRGFIMDRGSPAYRSLCLDLMKAQLDVLEILKARDEGRFEKSTIDSEPGKPSLSIIEAFELYAKDVEGRITDHTLGQSRKSVGLFAEFVGGFATIDDMTKANARGWKQALEKWPVKATEMKAFAGKSFSQIIEECQCRSDLNFITRKTIKKHMSALGGFSTWLVSQGYLERNPVSGLYSRGVGRDSKIRPFNVDELRQIFASPVFTGCKSLDEEYLPGTVKVGDHRFWLPLMALFTGARLGELAQLRLNDIRKLHGVWIAHITKEGKGDKRTKTQGSQRVVPIHSMLIRIGFLDYHAATSEAGSAQLFPELKPDSRGHYSAIPSRWFGRYLQYIGVKENKEINFHSFRHTASDALRRGGFYDEQFAPLYGHVKATTTARYGLESEATISQRREMIESISYDLDLSHLVQSSEPTITAHAA
jgi:integrase